MKVEDDRGGACRQGSPVPEAVSERWHGCKGGRGGDAGAEGWVG